MGPYKLMALDMDGTLLDDKQQISSENNKWIRAAVEAGVTVMYSTGRGIVSAMPYIEELQLTGPAVTVNGSEIWESPHKLLKRHLMDAKWIRKMHLLAVEQDTWFWGYAVNDLYNRDRWVDDPDTVQWLKFGYYTEDLAKLAYIRSHLEEWGVLELTNSHPCNLELNPLGISKASGVAEVCRFMGIGMDQVIAMGDSLNDLAVIRAVGLGVAVGNAQEEVKRNANVVTVTNEQDAVAVIIQQYVFGISV